MTTNKPEIRAFLMQQDGYEPYVSIGRDSNCSGVTHPLIRLSDYEALQAECEKLRKDAAFYRRLRSLTYEQLGQPGVPCVAVPEADNRGRYVAGEDLDAAMQEASHDS